MEKETIPPLTCPDCGSVHRQTKDGKTSCGSQRYQCQNCKAHYTPQPKVWGHPAETRMQAIRMYLEDGNFRRIARLLGVAPQSVATWVAQYVQTLQAQGQTPPQPKTVEIVELDELYTFAGAKKNVSISSPK